MNARSRCPEPLYLVVCSVLLVQSGCGRSLDSATIERIHTAEAAFADATEPAQFAAVAQQYAKITNGGQVSGQVLYNQGNAYLKSNQSGRAIAAYRQALRYRPRDAKLIANLESALGKPFQNATKKTVWEHLFIWQNWLSYREKFQLATVLLVSALTLIWYSNWYHPTLVGRRIGLALVLLFLLFAASSAVDWNRFERHQYGVLVNQTMPRKGNSENYDAAFKDFLSEGTEFQVLEQRGNWLRANFANQAEGWIPSEASSVY